MLTRDRGSDTNSNLIEIIKVLTLKEAKTTFVNFMLETRLLPMRVET